MSYTLEIACREPQKYCANFGRSAADNAATIHTSSEFFASFDLQKVQCSALAFMQSKSREERERRKLTRCLVKNENGVTHCV